MMRKYDNATCAECGSHIDSRSYTITCDYCLSKKED